jgi:hypothetical protein
MVCFKKEVAFSYLLFLDFYRSLEVKDHFLIIYQQVMRFIR